MVTKEERDRLTKEFKEQGRKKFLLGKIKGAFGKAKSSRKRAKLVKLKQAKVEAKKIKAYRQKIITGAIALAKKKKMSIKKKFYAQKSETVKELPFAKGLKKAFKKKRRQIITQYKRSQRPIRRKFIRRPMPPQLRRTLVKRQIQRSRPVIQGARFIKPVITVRQLQGMPPQVLAKMLTREEIVEVNRLMSSARRPAAIQMISRRLKEQERAQQVANPMVRAERDLMSGRDIVRREVPRESWAR